MTVAAVAAALVLGAPAARACDVCAVYTATQMREERTGLLVGLGEQATRYSTRIPDPAG